MNLKPYINIFYVLGIYQAASDTFWGRQGGLSLKIDQNTSRTAEIKVHIQNREFDVYCYILSFQVIQDIK